MIFYGDIVAYYEYKAKIDGYDILQYICIATTICTSYVTVRTNGKLTHKHKTTTIRESRKARNIRTQGQAERSIPLIGSKPC
jgi:hypothetical protein